MRISNLYHICTYTLSIATLGNSSHARYPSSPELPNRVWPLKMRAAVLNNKDSLASDSMLRRNICQTCVVGPIPSPMKRMMFLGLEMLWDEVWCWRVARAIADRPDSSQKEVSLDQSVTYLMKCCTTL